LQIAEFQGVAENMEVAEGKSGYPAKKIRSAAGGLVPSAGEIGSAACVFGAAEEKFGIAEEVFRIPERVGGCPVVNCRSAEEVFGTAAGDVGAGESIDPCAAPCRGGGRWVRSNVRLAAKVCAGWGGDEDVRCDGSHFFHYPCKLLGGIRSGEAKSCFC
jgi:hypothetical protein